MLRAVVCLAFAVALGAQTHKVPVADQWFPADAPGLNRLLDEAFAASGKRTGAVPPRRRLLGVIVPHAGLAYSGTVAAAAYSRFSAPKNVIILGFGHRRRFQGIAAPVLERYETPLGTIRVNQEAIRELGAAREPEGRLCDHSVENQLPFIQRAAPEAAVVPLFVGDLTEDELRSAARKLAKRVSGGDVIVASSDFTHYGKVYGYTPFPADAAAPAKLRDKFIEAFEQIGTMNVASFDTHLTNSGDTICGYAPIRLLMATFARWNEEVFVSPLDLMNSGDLTRDYSTSVTYGALAVYPLSAYAVGERARAQLLTSARRTLDVYLEDGVKTPVQVSPSERDPDLNQYSGVFVTIKKSGQLRGCVGDFGARQPLWSAVPGRTIAAASEDPRFPPITLKEGPLTLEISLLTPFRRISGWKEFRLGQGAILELNGKAATFLPQIAKETGWARERFLEELSKKAGLPPQSYKDPKAKLYVYSAHVFAEQAPPSVKRDEAGNGDR